jgi:hypothetical protein
MRKFLAGASLILLAACVAPAPPPPPAPRPAPPPPPPPAPVSQDWRDFPLTPGSWAYAGDAAGSSALFGRVGAEADLIVRCDRASRTVTLSWAGVPMPAGNATTITTSSGVVTYPAGAVSANRIGVRLAANDPFLDKLAFSRGRFVVAGAVSEQASVRLVIPAWPEPGRAVEDCRK